MMKAKIKSAAVGFAVALAMSATAAHAAQQEHHAQPPATSAQVSKAAPAKPMMMMGDAAAHKKMMEQMGQCRDMMSQMMEHMNHEGPMAKHPPAPPKQ